MPLTANENRNAIIKRIVLTGVGVLAILAIATSAWGLGSGEDLFWGMPSWLGLAIIALAAWWFPKAIISFVKRPDVGNSVEEPKGHVSGLLSGISVLVAMVLFVLGWIIDR